MEKDHTFIFSLFHHSMLVQQMLMTSFGGILSQHYYHCNTERLSSHELGTMMLWRHLRYFHLAVFFVFLKELYTVIRELSIEIHHMGNF